VAINSQLITRVDFVPFSTSDIEAACEFYGTALGLPRSVYAPERNYAEFEAGNVTISIDDGEKMGIGHHVQTIALALHIADVGAARATLEQRGVQSHDDTLDTGVCHMGFYADPDGNALMLHHRHAPRVAES
jgi:predicted enzyme related to lactoylglutathione lyase